MKTFCYNLLTSIDTFCSKSLKLLQPTQGQSLIFKGNFSWPLIPSTLYLHTVFALGTWFMDSYSSSAGADFLLPWLLGAQFKVKALPNRNRWQARQPAARLLTAPGCEKVRNLSTVYCLRAESIASILWFCFLRSSSSVQLPLPQVAQGHRGHGGKAGSMGASFPRIPLISSVTLDNKNQPHPRVMIKLGIYFISFSLWGKQTNKQPSWDGNYLLPFSRWENGGSERSHNFSKITQLLRSG